MSSSIIHTSVNKYGTVYQISTLIVLPINCNQNDNEQRTMKISNDKITRDARILREKNLHSNIPCDCLLRDKKPVQKIAIRNQWIYTIYVENHIERGKTIVEIVMRSPVPYKNL